MANVKWQNVAFSTQNAANTDWQLRFVWTHWSYNTSL